VAECVRAMRDATDRPVTVKCRIGIDDQDTEQSLDRFADAVVAIGELIRSNPEVLKSAPRFTPVDRVDEVAANRTLVLSEHLTALPKINENRLSPVLLNAMPIAEIKARILATV
jgi:hypothetical protein